MEKLVDPVVIDIVAIIAADKNNQPNKTLLQDSELDEGKCRTGTPGGVFHMPLCCTKGTLPQTNIDEL
jgi:hypothetical protein